MTHPPLLATLVVRSFRRAVCAFAAMTGVLVGFQVMLVLIATAFERTRSFALLSAIVPVSIQHSFGPGAFALASFPGLVTFGYFHPIVVLFVVQAAVYVATEPAGDVEQGLVDLVLARPVARCHLVTRSLVLAAGLTTATVGAMALGTWGGLAAFAPAGVTWPSPAIVAALAAHLLLVAWCFAAAALAAASVARRRGTAVTVVAVLAVFLYLLNMVAEAWEPAFRFRVVSPFHYFPGFAVAAGTAPTVHDLGCLALPAVVLTLFAYWQFGRRDL